VEEEEEEEKKKKKKKKRMMMMMKHTQKLWQFERDGVKQNLHK
jgi:hypothetical protein